MKIIEGIIVRYAEKLLSDMDLLSADLVHQTVSPLDDARMQLKNKAILDKMMNKKIILDIIKGLV